MDYHLNEAEEGRAKESLRCCVTWLAKRYVVSLVIAARMWFYRIHPLLALSVLSGLVNIKPIRGLDGL